MGTTESKFTAKSLRQNLTLERELSDPRFGTIQIFVNSANNEYIMSKEKVCRSTEEYKEIKLKFKERPNLVHKNLIQLVDFEEIKDDFVCGNLNKLIFRFEYHFHDLGKEILSRRRDTEFFTEEELWYMTDSLVSVLFYLQKYKISHGDIRPSNILLTKKGVVKIADTNFINEDSVYFKLLSQTFVENHYVGPDFMSSLKKASLTTNYDIHKNDVFSLGMTLLEAATLEYSSLCYDYKNFNINFSKIQGLIDSLKDKYSPFFTNFLRDLLQEKEKYRPNFEDLNSLLAPYQVEKGSKMKGNGIAAAFEKPKEVEKRQPIKTRGNSKEVVSQNNKENVLNGMRETAIENSARLRQKFVMNEEEPEYDEDILNNLRVTNKSVQFQNDSKTKIETKPNPTALSFKDENQTNIHQSHLFFKSQPRAGGEPDVAQPKPHDPETLLKNEVLESINFPAKQRNERFQQTTHFSPGNSSMNYLGSTSNQRKEDLLQSENDRLNEIERRINEALRLSEETIKNHEFKRDSLLKY